MKKFEQYVSTCWFYWMLALILTVLPVISFFRSVTRKAKAYLLRDRPSSGESETSSELKCSSDADGCNENNTNDDLEAVPKLGVAMNDRTFLRALCRDLGIPFESKCHHCKELHQAETYKIVEGDADEDDEIDPEFRGPSIIIDYGRCGAMTSPNQCFRKWLPASKAGRAAMKDLVRDLIGDGPL